MKLDLQACCRILAIVSVLLFAGMFFPVYGTTMMLLGRTAGATAIVSFLCHCRAKKGFQRDAFALLLLWLVVIVIITPVLMAAVPA